MRTIKKRKCENCGATIKKSDAYCEICGTKVKPYPTKHLLQHQIPCVYCNNTLTVKYETTYKNIGVFAVVFLAFSLIAALIAADSTSSKSDMISVIFLLSGIIIPIILLLISYILRLSALRKRCSNCGKKIYLSLQNPYFQHVPINENRLLTKVMRKLVTLLCGCNLFSILTLFVSLNFYDFSEINTWDIILMNLNQPAYVILLITFIGVRILLYITQALNLGKIYCAQKKPLLYSIITAATATVMSVWLFAVKATFPFADISITTMIKDILHHMLIVLMCYLSYEFEIIRWSHYSEK